MLPLVSSTVPDSAETLAQALKAGLVAYEVNAREVTATGAWPALEALQLDLTGAQISRSQRFVEPGDSPVAEFSAAKLVFTAAPARFESVPVHLSLHGDNVAFEITQAKAEEFALRVKGASHGTVAIEATRADLESLLHSLAVEAAGQRGVEVKQTQLAFTSRGSRALGLTVEVTAKMFIATATVKLSGDLDLDESLVARLSNLQFQGEGMVANMAGTLLKPQLARLEGRTFSLMSFAPLNLELHDVQLEAGESLRISAQFGS